MDESDEVLAMLRDAAGDFIEGRYDAAQLRRDSLLPRAADRILWREMGQMGWLGLGLPEAQGGSALALGAAATLAELFGRTLYAAPFVTCATMPSELVGTGANAACRDLAGILQDGERLLTVAWQEHAGQVEPGLPTTELRDGAVSGRKLFVPAVQADSVLLVSASKGGVPVIVAVAADAAGVRIEQTAAGIGSHASIVFEGAPILFGAPLFEGGEADAALARTVAVGRIVLSAQLAGLAAGCLAKTIDYVNGRVQFGHPIGAFQTIQHRCVDLHMATLLAGASWRNALARYESGALCAATEAAISAAKARCGEVAIDVARQAVQMHGAMGFAEEVDIGFYLRSALQASSQLGGPYQHRRRFVELTSPAKDFHG